MNNEEIKNEVKKASFDFSKFRFSNFLFNESPNNSEALSVDFKPNGVFFEKDGRFELTIIFTAFAKEKPENPIIQATVIGSFLFVDNPSFEEIPPYFYKNAIAIIFPYIRAFISSMTIQANSRIIVLPVLNLTSLEQPLKLNTTVDKN